jgi:hypothetical protein
MRIVGIMAYIVGAEVLWRATGAHVFWEYGKYAVSLLCLLVLLRHPRKILWGKEPVFYFIFLLPSIIPALLEDPNPRQAISFNLSGPFALMLCTLLLGSLSWKDDDLRNILLTISLPVAGIVAIALYSIQTHRTVLYFTTGSNVIASGGFGPNQVSSILGLAALMAFLYTLIAPNPRWFRWVLWSYVTWVWGHALLTFSRGGIYTALLALALGALHYWRVPRVRQTFLGGMVALLILNQQIIVDRLDALTERMWRVRLTELDTTHRWELFLDELDMWREYPLMGVGVGQARWHRARTHKGKHAHTEFSRLLAEHGLLGCLALIMLIGMWYRHYRSCSRTQERALVAVWGGWAMLMMTHAAMRIAAIPFMFALSGIPRRLNPSK